MSLVSAALSEGLFRAHSGLGTDGTQLPIALLLTMLGGCPCAGRTLKHEDQLTAPSPSRSSEEKARSWYLPVGHEMVVNASSVLLSGPWPCEQTLPLPKTIPQRQIYAWHQQRS